MSKLNGFPAWQQLYVDLSGANKRIISTNEREHSSVPGQSGIHRRVGKERQLLPLTFWPEARSGAASERKTLRPQIARTMVGRKYRDSSQARFFRLAGLTGCSIFSFSPPDLRAIVPAALTLSRGSRCKSVRMSAAC